ncbi:MAG: restriction endonuclease [Isosphaeraceae bacterium]
MSTPLPVQSIFSLPGGKGKYVDTLVEFLSWLSGRENTNRLEAGEWFDTRFGAARSTQYYLAVLRDFGVVELDRGKQGAVRQTDLGRKLLKADQETQVAILVERFVDGFAANREILDTFAKSNAPVSLQELRSRLREKFPFWTSVYQYDYRLGWFDTLGLLRSVSGRTFEITPKGKEYSHKYPPTENHIPPILVVGRNGDTNPPEITSPLEELISELRSASIDSTRPSRFENALGRAFETLGYSVKQLGESGDTDVLAEAAAGNDSYLIVADAKSRGTGKVDQLEVLSLKDHQTLNEADYAVVVAGGFAGGKVAAHAAEHGVTLLPLGVLEAWLRLHDAWPQDLIVYRSIFTIKGFVENLPAELLRVTNDRKRWGRLLADIVDLFSETYEHGLSEPLSPRDVFRMLVTRKRGVPYPERDVSGILEMLSHPVVGALNHKEGGYILVMSRETLGLRLRRLAEEVESLDSIEPP